MTPAQRRFKFKWGFALTVLLLLVVFDDFVESNAGWLRWIFLAALVFASLGERRSRHELADSGRNRVAELLESAPWLKVWFTLWAVVFTATAIFATRNSVDLFQVIGLKFLFLAFAILLAPVVYYNEREKYRDLGATDDQN